MNILRVGLVCLACAATAAEETPRLVKALAALMQGVDALERFAAEGEWSAVHNEDVTLAGAVEAMRADAQAARAATRDEIGRLLTRFGRQVGDLHAAADASQPGEARQRLRALLDTYARLRRLYAGDALAAARRLADVYACPMHRDVVGARTDVCRKCGMALDYAVRVPVSHFGLPESRTIRARIRLRQPLTPGGAARATLFLTHYGEPALVTDFQVVHTERIHLLIVDPSLNDYHHVHPQPTDVPGAYAFSFTPATPGPYHAWADVRTTAGGFQEYAPADIPGPAGAPAAIDRTVRLEAGLDGLRYTLRPERLPLVAGEPVRARLRVTDARGTPFTRLEPIMGTFAHVVAFHENRKTLLHLHPLGTKAPGPADRGGPELVFQVYATEPGYYRLFAQVQIGGAPAFVPFGLHVAAARATAAR